MAELRALLVVVVWAIVATVVAAANDNTIVSITSIQDTVPVAAEMRRTIWWVRRYTHNKVSHGRASMQIFPKFLIMEQKMLHTNSWPPPPISFRLDSQLEQSQS